MSDTILLQKYESETWSKQKYSRFRYVAPKFGTGIPWSLAYWMYFLPGCIRASFLHAKLMYFGDDEGLVYLIDVSFLFHGKQCSCQWEIFKHN